MIINIQRKFTFTSISLSIIIFLCACNKKEGVITPINNATLSFQSLDKKDVKDSIVYPTSFPLKLNVEIDSSIYTYKWDFGNGQLSNSYDPEPIYNDAGIYSISLYMNSKDGHLKDTLKKTVIIKDRMLQSIKINKIDWTNIEYTSGDEKIPLNAHIDVFCRILSSDKSVVAFDNVFSGTSQVFQSKTVNNAVINSSIEIDIDTTVYLPTPYTTKKYGYCVYGIYNNKIYLLSTNWANGISSSFYDNPLISSGDGYSFSSQLTVGFPVGTAVFYGNFQYP